jgi:GNAT superfamily N-acetyltransferase
VENDMPEPSTDRRVLVRERRDEDLAACAEILTLVHATDGYPVEGVADPVAWLSPPAMSHAWIAVLDGRVAGHVTISSAGQDDDAAELLRHHTEHTGHTGEIATLGRLFVHPDARGHHLGRRLVTTATDHARHHHLRLVLDVITKDTNALHLYENLGWHLLGTTTHHYGHRQHAPARCYTAPARCYTAPD